MHAEDRSRSRDQKRQMHRRSRPRVVLFHIAGTARVEILDLPENTRPGDRLCHAGRDWLITGSRTGTRVLIAEPEAN